MDKKLLRTFVLCLIIQISSGISFAGRGDKAGSAAAPQLLIPVGVRSIALGGSTLATATGIEAIYWNPAGLTRSSHNSSAMFTHMNYIADIGIEYLAVSSTFSGLGTIGLSIKSLSLGDIPITTEDQPDGTGEIASPTFVTIGGTISRLVADRVAIGITMNLIAERMERVSSSGIAFNIGLQYTGVGGIPGLDLGVVVKNIGPQMQYDGPGLLRTGNIDDVLRPGSFYQVQAASAELPSVMEMGLGYTFSLSSSDQLITSAMFQNNNFSDDEYKLGAEYLYANIMNGIDFALRSGYNIVSKSLEGENIFSGTYAWSFGTGIQARTGDVDITVDYAYRAVQYFGGNHVIGIGLGF